ncbi:homoserine acetyltransferase [Erwinia typographi]|uniref:Homoserine acetyltransferase n=1 Tax=Erwinia typographi TaxID=371042 RepID=A0A0A3ZNU0_9GAMM|nr:alpha/beta fold hydrolase [Erwinia typographi]KGT87388.1 homoserine acetyltransferase [Erwinia typographi]
MSKREFHQLGDLALAQGGVLREAQIGWQAFGQLNAARDNAVVLFSYYTGSDRSYHPLIGEGRALDPARWYIVLVNMFGNGVSTSPSNSRLQPGSQFPQVTLIDNIHAQYQLLINHLGIRQIALASGWSMGAMQAWHWAAAWPSLVRNVLAVCGSARCWPLNHLFLDGVKAALQADEAWQGGNYSSPPLKGLAAFGRVYAGWAYSAQFFREQRYQQLGFASQQALLQAWEEDHQGCDANDLLAMLYAWQQADIGLLADYRGDWTAALKAITARTRVMPCDTDSYFTLEESRLECGLVSGGEFQPIVSPCGHCAGAPGRFAQESAQIEQAMRDLLA